MWLKYAVSVFRQFSTRYFGVCLIFLRFCGIGFPQCPPRTGCRNVCYCQQQSYSGLRSPGRSNSTYFWNDSWVQTFHRNWLLCASKIAVMYKVKRVLLEEFTYFLEYVSRKFIEICSAQRSSISFGLWIHGSTQSGSINQKRSCLLFTELIFNNIFISSKF